MKAIAILPEGDDAHPTAFRAVTGDRKAAGRTPGEALDALTSQPGAEKAGAAVVVQLFRPDSHFTGEQSERLSALMSRWRSAREAGSTLSAAEQAELERLVEDELQGSAERSAQMSHELETTGELRHQQVNEKKVGPPVKSKAYPHLWLSFLLCLTLLSGVIVFAIVLSIGSGLVYSETLLIVLATANIIVQLLTSWSAFQSSRLIKREVINDSLEDSAGGGKQRKQARVR